MRVILDINDDVLEDMKLAAEIKGMELGTLLSDVFIKYLRDPANTINELHEKGEEKSLEHFAHVLHYYLTEAINDLRESAKHEDEALPHDEAMIKVYEHLRDEHIQYTHLFIDLYKVFKAAK